MCSHSRPLIMVPWHHLSLEFLLLPLHFHRSPSEHTSGKLKTNSHCEGKREWAWIPTSTLDVVRSWGDLNPSFLGCQLVDIIESASGVYETKCGALCIVSECWSNDNYGNNDYFWQSSNWKRRKCDHLKRLSHRAPACRRSPREIAWQLTFLLCLT